MFTVLGAVSVLVCMLPCAVTSILLGVFAFKRAPANNTHASRLSCAGIILGVLALVLAVVLVAVGLAFGLGLSSQV